MQIEASLMVHKAASIAILKITDSFCFGTI